MPRAIDSALSCRLLLDREAKTQLMRLASASNQISVAVAWATPNDALTAFLNHDFKLERVVVGTSLYQTSPDVIDDLSAYHDIARCVPPTGTLFHPKVYLFELPGDRAAALVGSHNLTQRGMDSNTEASLLMEGPARAPEFVALRRFIHDAWRKAEVITDLFRKTYRANYDARRAERSSLEAFTKYPRPNGKSKVTSRSVRQLPATWAELVKAVKTDSHSPNQERLALLHAARNLFAKGPFASLDVSERKLLAGMEDEAGWFGRMTGHGDFHSLVNDSPGGLGAAIDVIPLMGPVTRVDYDRYVVLFRAAFKQASHGAGIASGSRLLALKRPDVFLPYNGANAHGVSQAFGIARTTTTLDNYWDRIVAPLQLLPWMTMPRPNKRVEGAIWDGRAALLDTLYYTPT